MIAHVRHAGLPVELRIHGEPIPLPDGVDGCAYRLIQEGLTNVLKHAGPLPTGVSLRYQPDAFELEVHNADGDPRRRAPDEPGHGLIGMRERVALYGGDLQAGARPTGGYTLHARLPLGGLIT